MVYLVNDLGGAQIALNAAPFFLDGKEIAAVSAREYTWFYLQPGPHEISVNDGSLPGYAITKCRISFEAGHSYIVRYVPDTRRVLNGAILGAGIIYAATGKQMIEPYGMPVEVDESANRVLSGLDLVGNSAE